MPDTKGDVVKNKTLIYQVITDYIQKLRCVMILKTILRFKNQLKAI